MRMFTCMCLYVLVHVPLLPFFHAHAQHFLGIVLSTSSAHILVGLLMVGCWFRLLGSFVLFFSLSLPLRLTRALGVPMLQVCLKFSISLLRRPPAASRHTLLRCLSIAWLTFLGHAGAYLRPCDPSRLAVGDKRREERWFVALTECRNS